MHPLLRGLSLVWIASLGAAWAQPPGIEPGWQFGAAQANFSGTWKLNREKSRYGSLRKPVSVIVTIMHKEPAFQYSGSVVDADGDLRNFEFSGNIDGRDYPATRAFGHGAVSLKWIAPNAMTATFRSNDGKWVEITTWSLSRTGRTLTQRVRLKGPDGEISWTEIYDKL
jgi:hypothetical protein